MKDGVISESSFTFTVAKDGEEWATASDDKRTVIRVIHEVGGLYDVCVCVSGAYHATDSGIARSLFVEHGLRTGRLSAIPTRPFVPPSSAPTSSSGVGSCSPSCL